MLKRPAAVQKRPAHPVAAETDQGKRLQLSVATLSGQELAIVDARASWRLPEVLASLPEDPTASSGPLPKRRRLLLGPQELSGARSLGDLGAVSGEQLTLLQSHKPCVIYGEQCKAKLACLETGECLRSFEGHEGYLRCIAFSSDNASVLTSADDNLVKLWRTASGECLQTFSGHAIFVQVLRFSPDGLQLLSASIDGVAKLWSVAGECLLTLSKAPNALFMPSGNELLTVSSQGAVGLWCKATGQRKRSFEVLAASRSGLSHSPDGSELLLPAKMGAEVWSVATGERLLLLEQEKRVLSAAFSPVSKLLLTSNVGGTVRLWLRGTGQCVRTLQAHVASCMAAFSPDGMRIVTACQSSRFGHFTAKIWMVGTAQQQQVLQGHDDAIWEAWWSPNSEHVLTKSEDGSTRIWNAKSGECLRTIQGEFPVPGPAAFSH